jgi:hypothetical protein
LWRSPSCRRQLDLPILKKIANLLLDQVTAEEQLAHAARPDGREEFVRTQAGTG